MSFTITIGNEDCSCFHCELWLTSFRLAFEKSARPAEGPPERRTNDQDMTGRIGGGTNEGGEKLKPKKRTHPSVGTLMRCKLQTWKNKIERVGSERFHKLKSQHYMHKGSNKDPTTQQQRLFHLFKMMEGSDDEASSGRSMEQTTANGEWMRKKCRSFIGGGCLYRFISFIAATAGVVVATLCYSSVHSLSLCCYCYCSTILLFFLNLQ